MADFLPQLRKHPKTALKNVAHSNPLLKELFFAIPESERKGMQLPKRGSVLKKWLEDWALEKQRQENPGFGDQGGPEEDGSPQTSPPLHDRKLSTPAQAPKPLELAPGAFVPQTPVPQSPADLLRAVASGTLRKDATTSNLHKTPVGSRRDSVDSDPEDGPPSSVASSILAKRQQSQQQQQQQLLQQQFQEDYEAVGGVTGRPSVTGSLVDQILMKQNEQKRGTLLRMKTSPAVGLAGLPPPNVGRPYASPLPQPQPLPQTYEQLSAEQQISQMQQQIDFLLQRQELGCAKCVGKEEQIYKLTGLLNQLVSQLDQLVRDTRAALREVTPPHPHSLHTHTHSMPQLQQQQAPGTPFSSLPSGAGGSSSGGSSMIGNSSIRDRYRERSRDPVYRDFTTSSASSASVRDLRDFADRDKEWG